MIKIIFNHHHYHDHYFPFIIWTISMALWWAESICWECESQILFVVGDPVMTKMLLLVEFYIFLLVVNQTCLANGPEIPTDSWTLCTALDNVMLYKSDWCRVSKRLIVRKIKSAEVRNAAITIYYIHSSSHQIDNIELQMDKVELSYQRSPPAKVVFFLCYKTQKCITKFRIYSCVQEHCKLFQTSFKLIQNFLRIFNLIHQHD